MWYNIYVKRKQHYISRKAESEGFMNQKQINTFIEMVKEYISDCEQESEFADENEFYAVAAKDVLGMFYRVLENKAN